MRRSPILGAIIASAMAGTAMAQQTVVEEHTTVDHNKAAGTTAGAATGAVTGAVVGGPVGAVVGGVIGATVGHSVAPPDDVRTYVTTQHVAPVAYNGEVVVGHTIDGEVVWSDVPNEPKYGWAYLGDKRVVIDRSSHKVVAIY